MLKNYFKTALRNLSRNKTYSLLNIAGLALGIGCALVIYKVIGYEQSFDVHQENYDRIYRVFNEVTRPNEIKRGMGTPHPVGPALKADFPELENVVRVHYTYGGQMNVKEGDVINKFLLEEGCAFVEHSFFEVFNVDFIAGDEATVLTEPNTVVISEKESRKLFNIERGEEASAMGRVINYNNHKDFKVVGIIKDPPTSTNFPFTLLFEYESQNHEGINPYYGEGKRWGSTSSNTNTFFLANQGFDLDDFNAKLIPFIERNVEEGESKRRRFIAQPLSAVHFDSVINNFTYTTSKQLLLALSFIAIFLVLTACINFVNLATAQAANRSKEIGIRKAVGGYTKQLVLQFFSEITVISFLSVLLALAVAEFLFVQLEEILDVRLALDLLHDLRAVGFLILLFAAVSFLSGFYPSILLSRMNTVLALKNKITAKSHSGGLNLRKALVVTQFTISQFLIIGTVIISVQMNYFTTKDLGFEKEAIIKNYLPERNLVKQDRFRDLMLAYPAIENLTYALSSPTGNSNSHSSFNYAPLESEENFNANFKCADEHYMTVYGLELLAGRNFYKNDSADYVIINEKMAKLMGFVDDYEGIIGESITSGWNNNSNKKVIGVMRDFHDQDLSEEVNFTLLIYEPRVFYELAFKTSEGANVKAAISHFESTWEEVYPEYVVDWQFFDEELAENYEQEQNIASLMNTFTIVSILIGCLGLYGLISFIAENRKKEVGIRKVLGASVFNIITRFSLEILILVGIASIVASPLAYFILDQWLDNYTFRISIGVEFFVLAFLTTLFIAVLTIGYRTINTALLNPATTLKDE